MSRRLLLLFKQFLLVLSVVLCLALAFCYWLQPDACAAVTYWPVWLWLFIGIPLTVLAARKKAKRNAVITGLMWIALVLVFAEEPRALIPHSSEPAEKQIRIVSLNLAGGNADAAAELAKYKPDIVLIQESPSGEEVSEYASRLFGEDTGIVVGVDACVIARGKVVPHLPRIKRKSHFTGARVKLKSGHELDVISVRLSPPGVPWELWSKKCWQDEQKVRQEHRALLKEVVESLPEDATTVVLGGDMNGPAMNGALKALRPRFHDAYREGGRGNGNTILNEIPVSRFDQIWLSDNLKAVKVVSRKTQGSDHRTVVCDVVKR